MENSSKRWQIAPVLTPEAEKSLSDFQQPLRQILFNRGYSTPTSALNYLAATPPPDCEPSNLLGMEAAVERISSAIVNKEKIAIYGDYDADGVTATALMVQVLSALGSHVEGYIPNRFDEGYGLNNEALDNLHEQGVDLIVTVDCGMRSIEEADHAKDLGLDLIITDHHHPGEELPRVVAVINPKQLGDNYPDKNLAGVGLAYKLAVALLDHLRRKEYTRTDLIDEADLLDLVALGTVADLAPLIDENRSLVRAGLNAIQQPRRQGLQALIGVCGLVPRRVKASDIGFALGPRLNAAGRLDSALAAFELLTTQSINEAGRLAQQLDNQNRERQKITREIQIKAEQIALAGDPDTLLLFAADPEFNPGIVGLAASRLNEHYYRPAIVAHKGEKYTRGSCRSIPEFHITNALDQCEELMEHHGGHAAAAGFTVRNENLSELVSRLRAIANEQISDIDLRPVLHADLEIQLSDLVPEILEQLEILQPTGYGNPQAIFVSRELKVNDHRLVGRDGTHLKLTVSDGWITYDAIAFGQGHWYADMPIFVDLMYTFEKNEFNGKENLQLKVKDIKPSDSDD
ncbi:MAG: single-stranded-DNA-specific exonuclease RecJ [Chloroflexi bacterium]|nr:single-stranded-DNA-specific exonuclease RecJ [Chloroflexota bacterium]